MARVAIRFAPEQVVAGLLVRCQRVLALQEGVEFRRERADLHGLLVGVKGLPPVVSQISSVSPGNLMFNEPFPHTSSKRGRYTACESLNAMQAVSGLPISWVSTGGCCACSASAFLSRYPVARESQKLPPKKAPSTWLYCS